MASWDDPTGEVPVVQTGPIEHVPPHTPATGRQRSDIDRALTTAFIGVLVIAIAVGAFIYGRSRMDNSVSGPSSVDAPAPLVLPDVSTTSTTVRRNNTTTSTTAAPSDTIVSATIPVPITSPPQTTATTTPPTTATTATTTPPAPSGTNP